MGIMTFFISSTYCWNNLYTAGGNSDSASKTLLGMCKDKHGGYHFLIAVSLDCRFKKCIFFFIYLFINVVQAN